MEMEPFIETVRKYACLWNTTAIEYRDQELKDAAWAEVMKETGLASGECVAPRRREPPPPLPTSASPPSGPGGAPSVTSRYVLHYF